MPDFVQPLLTPFFTSSAFSCVGAASAWPCSVKRWAAAAPWLAASGRIKFLQDAAHHGFEHVCQRGGRSIAPGQLHPGGQP